jgi:prevent-host-death family protein
MEHDPNRKGNAAELAIAAEAAKLELSVLKPLTEHERYDLVLGIGGRLWRVQCKWGSLVDEKIQVRLRSSYHSPTRGYVVKTYDRSEIDLVAVHCAELGRCYLLPPELFEGRSAVWLRTERTKNGQRAALNWAADYEFPGAVAQLAERPNGIREARGSNPLSSTPSPSEETSSSEQLADNVINVGAHRFRNHFGFYMEQAADGAEVLVSRHGSPFVRLLAVGRSEGARDQDEVEREAELLPPIGSRHIG